MDNASEDGSAESIREHYSDRVELIVNPKNLGGSGGFNAGLRQAMKKGYRYLMCIDNDVLVDECAVGELYDFLEKHPKVGMVGSKVYQMDDPNYVQEFGIQIDFQNYCVRSAYADHLEDGTLPEIVYSDCIPACSLMVRASVIQKIGLMPEENFLYWDDTEWGYLCNRAGFKVACYGKSKVLHHMGAKKESVNTFPTYYAWRNWINFFMKYTPVEKLQEMTAALLTSLFNITYESLYSGQKNKMETVMYAYDDAIHHVVGKTSEDKIFPLNQSNSKLAGLVRGKKRIFIQDNGYQNWGQILFKNIQLINPDVQRVQGQNYDISFTFCDYIFTLNDFQLKTVYIDIYGNIFATKSDALRIINYNYSKQSFLYAQQPLFLYKTKKLRNL